ncbi:Holliday junction branch migration protein RuvA [Alloscardovia omnicolens]
MIASLRGEVAGVYADSAIIEVAGVGYSMRMSGKDLSQLRAGREVYVLTTMTVSQDAIALYGFLHKATQDFFAQLTKVNGIGPRVAMAILSTLTTEDLIKAIRNNDVTALTKAPGLGKKGAQKIIVELSGSVNLDSLVSDSSSDSVQPAPHDASTSDEGARQVVQGLVSLGWQLKDAAATVEQTMTDLGLEIPLHTSQVPVVLREALTRLDRGR